MSGRLRITGGRLARRLIDVPPAADRGALRPTSDKVRAAMLNALADRLDGAVVVDVFAGSGALGLDALSRGACRCTFIERDARTARVIVDNAAALGLTEVVTVRVADAAAGLSSLAAAGAAVVLCDPPYGTPLGPLWRPLSAALAPGGALVIERGKRDADDRDAAREAGLSLVRERVYGDTRVDVFHREGP
jgi:16S rRNA (guanine966-N2)-methyltransferase